jgi:hypothetical protein
MKLIALVAALLLPIPTTALHAQTVDTTADRDAVNKVMHDYFEA